MAFLLSKIIGGLLMPFSLCLLLLIIGFIALIWQKRQLAIVSSGAGIVFLFLLGLPFVSNFAARQLEQQYQLPAKITDDVKYIVVLDGGNSANWQKHAEDQISSTSLHRLIKGVLLWRQHPKMQLLVSGGSYQNKSGNALTMKAVAESLGVPSNKILFEIKSLNTKDEAVEVKKMLGTQPFLLVTSATHMPRSMYLFKQAGTHPIAAPTDFIYDPKQRLYHDMLPSAHNLSNLDTSWHEYLGLMWAALRH